MYILLFNVGRKALWQKDPGTLFHKVANLLKNATNSAQMGPKPYVFGCILKTKPRSKNETSREIGQKKRNLGGGRFLKKKKRNLPEGQVSEKKTGQVAFFLVISAP